jgi:hypothetical protein
MRLSFWNEISVRTSSNHQLIVTADNSNSLSKGGLDHFNARLNFRTESANQQSTDTAS